MHNSNGNACDFSINLKAAVEGGASTSCLKFLAILSVIVAHVDIRVTGQAWDFIRPIYYWFGSFGVGVFFIILGLNFASRSSYYSLGVVVKRFVLPWFLSGAIVFLYLVTRKSNFPISMFGFILGNGSYLYFMSVFVFFVFFGRFFLISRLLRQFFLLVSLVYLLLAYPLMPEGVSEYLNILLWYPYVVFGYVFSKGGVSSLGKKNTEFLMITAFAVFGIFFRIFDFSPHSWLNYQNTNLVFFVCFFYYLAFLLRLQWKVSSISRNTLFVYLWHMPLVGLVNWLGNNFYPYMHFFSPIVVLLFFWVFINYVVYKFPLFFAWSLLGIDLRSDHE